MGSDSVDGYDALLRLVWEGGVEGKKEGWEYKLNQSFIPFLIFSIYENSKARILSCDRSDLCIEDHINYISHLL